MNNVEKSLLRLTQIMSEVGKAVAQGFNPGLPEEEIVHLCQQSGVVLPFDLVDLYRYCDGMKPFLLSIPQKGEYGLDGLYLLLPLDEALREYGKVKENALYDNEIKATWFPFLREEGGDLYLVDTAVVETEEPPVVWWMMEFAPVQIYSSLPAMFDTLADSYEAGAYEKSHGLPDLTANLQMSLIARQRNPNVSYWQERVQELSGLKP